MALHIVRSPSLYGKHRGVKKKKKKRAKPLTPSLPSRPRDNRLAVVFDCAWNRLHVGWDILARRYGRAMSMVNIDVRHYPVTHEKITPEVQKESAALSQMIDAHDVYVWSTCFHRPDVLIPALVQQFSGRTQPRVFYTMFERLRATRVIASWFNSHVNGVWVPCTANRDALVEAGCNNVRWIPVPWFDDDDLLRIPRPRTSRSFYWIGTWEARKAPDMLLRAFTRAFKPGEATLVLKTALGAIFGRGYPTPEIAIESALHDPIAVKNGWKTPLGIVIDRRPLSRAELLSEVHARGDVYVSASRGEGVDMPAFEAKLAGRRVITTDSGGPRDFLGSSDILVARTGELPVPPVYSWERGSAHADYSLDDLTAALQRARSEGVVANDWPRENFHCVSVGRSLKDWFEELRVAR